MIRPAIRLGRVGLFLPEAWTAAPWIAALVGADDVLPEPGIREAGRLDAVVIGPDPRSTARGLALARAGRLPVQRLDPAPLGPAAPPRLGIPPLAAILTEVDPETGRHGEGPLARALGEPLPPPEQAAALVAFVLAHRLLAPEIRLEAGAPSERRPVLVADWPDDGRAPPDAPESLWQTLRARFPLRDMALVVEPQSHRSGRPGLLARFARDAGLPILADDGRSDWLDGVEVVAGPDDRLGLEALFAGRRVLTGGAPLHAGWGLTDDLALDPGAAAVLATRSARRPSRLDLAGALLAGAIRYADPFRLAPLEPEAGLALIADLRARYAARTEPLVCVGFSAQKARTATTFLAGWANPIAFTDARRAVAEALAARARLVVWGARGGPALIERAIAAGLAVTRLEDGFVRSVGLGTKQTVPASLALDETGLYYDARGPSGFERLARESEFAPDLVARARALRERLVATRVTKYNLPAPKLDLRPEAAGRRIVLVVGQVPDDAAIRYGTVSVTGNLALLAAVRQARPDAYILYKEHPDLVTRSRAGWLPEALIRAHADRALREGDAVAAIEAVDEVHTLTSLAGFEALIRGVPVVTWGIPFYAGWGLTEDRETIPRRGRRLALDELVAAALILYPTYVDPVSRLPCEVETVIERIEAIRAGRLTAPSAVRWRRLVRASVVAEAYLRHWIGHWRRPR